MMADLSEALAPLGYTVTPMSTLSVEEAPRGPRRRTKRAAVPEGRKALKCPRCPRRFAHPLPMSRHLVATHGQRRARWRPR